MSGRAREELRLRAAALVRAIPVQALGTAHPKVRAAVYLILVSGDISQGCRDFLLAATRPDDGAAS